MSLTALLTLGSTLVDKFIPDPQAKAAHNLKLAELAASGDERELQAYLTQISGQLEINKVEASHPSVYVAGWRPFIGWTGGIALAYQFVLYPILLWLTAVAFPDVVPPPILPTDSLWTIVAGMLGIGGMRSWDKTKKVDTTRIN